MEPMVNPMVEAVQIALTGVSVVFMALTLVALMLSLIGRIDKPIQQLMSRGKAVPEPAQAPVAPVVEATDAELTPELIAILTVAANEVLQQPVRITRVQYNQPQTGAWSSQGRISIMASRRRRDR
ncbi:OadG family protein [Candidatus Chloroploca sp. M-50]|uniref:OadG family protein n=1 Tax=Candidatus Chloroploca mongolica TaxID=2528176 RepID=A0ABS4DFD9_9CHLR|nr:OadG family transporter subunit [Candidatus Chloroploca mongolica]MBP1468074.1 OadG family protein [Candidatus Chloroploca mongolica]